MGKREQARAAQEAARLEWQSRQNGLIETWIDRAVSDWNTQTLLGPVDIFDHLPSAGHRFENRAETSTGFHSYFGAIGYVVANGKLDREEVARLVRYDDLTKLGYLTTLATTIHLALHYGVIRTVPIGEGK